MMIPNIVRAPDPRDRHPGLADEPQLTPRNLNETPHHVPDIVPIMSTRLQDLHLHLHAPMNEPKLPAVNARSMKYTVVELETALQPVIISLGQNQLLVVAPRGPPRLIHHPAEDHPHDETNLAELLPVTGIQICPADLVAAPQQRPLLTDLNVHTAHTTMIAALIENMCPTAIALLLNEHILRLDHLGKVRLPFAFAAAQDHTVDAQRPSPTSNLLQNNIYHHVLHLYHHQRAHHLPSQHHSLRLLLLVGTQPQPGSPTVTRMTPTLLGMPQPPFRLFLSRSAGYRSSKKQLLILIGLFSRPK